MAEDISIEMNVERKNLFAMADSEKIALEVPTVLVLVEGEIIVRHQKCNECRPKTTTLPKLGSQITLETGVTYLVKNNTMKRAAYLVIYPEVIQSD